MAAPIAAAVAVVKAAYKTNKNVKRYVPGGWKTVSGFLIVVLIVAPITVVYAMLSSIQFMPDTSAFCSPIVSQSGADSDNHGDGEGNPGGGVDTGYGRHQGPNVPFPTASSSTIVYPIKGASNNSGYGFRGAISTGSGQTNTFHDGTDFGAGMGTPIVAMADGIVSMSTNATGTQEGSMVEIQHLINGEKYTSAYRHVQGKTITVKVGDTVRAGQQIAGVGSEGYSTGPHLHFVVAKGSYHRWNSTSGPAGTINSTAFLTSNGAVTAGGGLSGDEFTGVNGDNDLGCATEGGTRLPGDGTTKWGSFENGKFDKNSLTATGGSYIYTDAAYDFRSMAQAYQKDIGKKLNISLGYLSYEDQQKRYSAGTQIEKPGMSPFGWARLAQVNIPNDRSSKEYKWLVDNASTYGFEQPSMYARSGSASDARVWGYVGGTQSDAMGIPDASNASVASNRATAKSILDSKHPNWGANEYSCLVNLWHKESGWDHKAANPTSSARGIPQAMMSIHFGGLNTAAARNYMNNPEVQIQWGLDYITRTYNTPCEAWAFWQETDPSKKRGQPGNWY